MGKHLRIVGCLAAAMIAGGAASAQPPLGPTLIYGDDNRLEYYELNDPQLLAISQSSVALFMSENLVAEGDYFRATGETFGETYNLCPTERFVEQEVPAFCSGILIGPDLVLTAGHCFEAANECKDTFFAFDFKQTQAGELPRYLHKSDVYRCKSLVKWEPGIAKKDLRTKMPGISEAAMDLALIRLDRKVTGRPHVSLERTGGPRLGDRVAAIGFPAGLPMKFATNALVRNVGKNYFVANLDVHAGSSGSPVFNQSTGKLEGILIEGDEDWKYTKARCYASKRCLNFGCIGESILKIDAILDYAFPQPPKQKPGPKKGTRPKL